MKQKKENLISVIIPVYNAEKYLAECIESMLAQTYHNFELLLIDDGSTDTSGQICEEYGKKDKRIKVFHKKNGGVSAARNTGLEHCLGEYVAFADSDDYVAKNYLEALYLNLKNYQVDISVCNIVLFGDGWNFEKFHQIPSGMIACGDRLDYCEYGILHGPCAKLFSKCILKNLHFDTDLVIGEDALFVAQAMKNTDWLYLDSQALYVYRMREDSAMHTLDAFKWRAWMSAWERISKLHEAGSMSYWSAKLFYLTRFRQLLNVERDCLSNFRKETRQCLPAFWKARVSLKEKILLLLLAFYPSVYFKIHAWVKRESN